MGCAQSKIENEEAVTRCKDRKQFLKEAVKNRNYFAATHSAYTVSLRHTGAALSDYGEGEVDAFHRDTLLPSSSALPAAPRDILPPPPPPLPNFGPPKPLQRAATMPEFSIPKPDLKPTTSDTIEEEEIDVEDEDDDERNGLSHRRRSRKIVNEEVEEEPPPRPREPSRNPVPPPPESSNTTSVMDYLFAPIQDMPMSSLSEVDEIQSFKDDSRDGRSNYDTGFKKSNDIRVDSSSSDAGNASTSSSTIEVQVPVEKANEVKPVKKTKQYVHSSSMDVEGNRSGKVLNMMDLLKELDNHFLSAFQSAAEVSKMLEANRLHFHSNYADNRGHIDHSKRVMQVITWNKSFRGLQNANDEKDEDETDETLASVLDKILAWEKKLYDEIKVGEVMKFDYQKKVALLNRQKSRNPSDLSLEKTKTAVSHLHTRYIIDMQSLDSTVSEIDTLRDEHLYPKLVSLVDGMAKMWETMNQHHRIQLKIVTDVKFLDTSNAPLETSDKHHQCTVQLHDVVEDWYVQLKAVMSHKKAFVKALNSWLKLNLIPVDSSLKEQVPSPPRVRLPVQSLLLAWQEYLEKIPDELGRSAISSFAHVMKNIVMHQKDEIKLRMTCEDTRRELFRKTRAFEDWYNRNKDIERPEDANHKDSITARKIQVELVKNRLEEEEAAYRKQCKQVRDKSTVSMKTHLPDLFRAMSDFTNATALMYQKLQSIAQSQKNPTHT
ncbi:hypothetical protein C5167_018786 [Papaver somniferum]|uniref:DUF632 domain-containing protein n=1 Tax=Papaver somniferum TaxID=3469 RepID=A0A4Y7IRL2_PAPSO|nr:nitrate regulatory gene2 protein-like [Papaver somniferum]RZC50352.1 hypothetical protein C5167_018786 [Papaver somniferum]